jgi:hypothetical protein
MEGSRAWGLGAPPPTPAGAEAVGGHKALLYIGWGT